MHELVRYIAQKALNGSSGVFASRGLVYCPGDCRGGQCFLIRLAIKSHAPIPIL